MCDKLQMISDENNISFIVGTIYQEEEIYNRAILFQPNSQVKFYDKRALWGWDVDNFTQYRYVCEHKPLGIVLIMDANG